MTDKEFEKYWKSNRENILSNNAEYQRAIEHFKMTSGSDWLLFGIPIVAGIVFINNSPIKSEILNWLASAGITIVCFGICVWIKSLIIGSESPDQIEEKLKKQTKREIQD